MNYISYLIELNKSICNDSQIRDYKSLELINNAIDVAFRENDEYLILDYSMQVAALIKLFQPFYDGNHRTALIVFGDLISKKGYTFDYTSALNDMLNKKLNIPTIYSETDRVGKYNQWFKYINKKKIL